MASTKGHTFPRRVLVTGGCGFIGSAVVRHLVGDLAVDVLNLDKLTYAGDPSTVAPVAGKPGYTFARVDICDGRAVMQAFSDFRPDVVIHLAAESHVDRSIDGPADFVQTNVVGTFSMLEAALRYWQSLDGAGKAGFRFLHVSTDEVYGSLALDTEARFEPGSPHAPNSPYAASKAGADHLARAWFRTYGLPVMISNCSNNYGPYQFPEKLIPTIVIAGIEGSPMPVYGQGLNVRDWLHVEDHVRALAAMVERGEPGTCYLVGGGAERSNIDLVRALCGLLDEMLPDSPHRPHDRLIRFVSDRPGHDLRYSVDDGLTRTGLGWEPRETLATGLRGTVAWYRDNQDWWHRIRESRHAGGRLGLARQQAAK
jgi:dTDP-glucose 4,6-dehydratase